MAKMNKKETQEIRPCMFARMDDDEFCAVCNGVDFEEDGQVMSATNCGGYCIVDDYAGTPVVEESSNHTREGNLSHVISNSDSDATIYTPKFKTTKIHASIGLSMEVRGVWHKLSYSEERELPEDCCAEKEKELLWEAVRLQIEEQATKIKQP